MGKLVLQLPIPHRLLSPNARVHWAVKAKLVKSHRQAAKVEAWRVLGGAKPPLWAKARYKATLLTLRASRLDPDNFNAMLKSYLDGIADAGVVANDRGLWPERPEFLKTDKFPRVEIEIEQEETE